MTITTVSFNPPGLTRAGGYEVDRFVVEYDDRDDTLDFRFELGVSVGIYWALPAAPNDRMRVLLVDGAAFHVDEPSLTLDPFCCDVPRFDFRPGLKLARGRELVSVAFEAGIRPGRYRCELSVLGRDGHDELRVLHWQRQLPPGVAGLRARLGCLLDFFELPEGDAEDLELEAVALASRGELDARQRELVLAVVAARRTVDPNASREAARACLAALP